MEENKEIKEQEVKKDDKKIYLIAGIIGFIIGFAVTVVIGVMFVNSKLEKEDNTTTTTTKETSTTTTESTTVSTTTTTTQAVEPDNGHKNYDEPDNVEIGEADGPSKTYKTEDYTISGLFYDFSLKIGKKNIKLPFDAQIFMKMHRFKYFMLLEYADNLDNADFYFLAYDYDGKFLGKSYYFKKDLSRRTDDSDVANDDYKYTGYKYNINDKKIYIKYEWELPYLDEDMTELDLDIKKCNEIKNNNPYSVIYTEIDLTKEKYEEKRIDKYEYKKDIDEIYNTCNELGVNVR